jgi:hypothetical protein
MWKAFRRNLVPPSSGCNLIIPTLTLSLPFHAISISDCHRNNRATEPYGGRIWRKSIRHKKGRVRSGWHSPYTSALSQIVTAGRHLMALKSLVRVGHSRWQQRAACTSLHSVPLPTDSSEGNHGDWKPVWGRLNPALVPWRKVTLTVPCGQYDPIVKKTE